MPKVLKSHTLLVMLLMKQHKFLLLSFSNEVTTLILNGYFMDYCGV